MLCFDLSSKIKSLTNPLSIWPYQQNHKHVVLQYCKIAQEMINNNQKPARWTIVLENCVNKTMYILSEHDTAKKVKATSDKMRY